MIVGKMNKYVTFVKYGLVGSLGTAFDVGSLYVFVRFMHLHLLFATAISFILAVTNNFVLNKYWTFENSNSNFRKQFIKFLIVSVIGLGWTELCMGLFVYLLNMWYVIAKLLTAGIVLMWNFLANKYWTFRDRIYPLISKEKYDFDVTIIVPAYNEERRIKLTLEAINEHFKCKPLTRELLVVDDGSRDNTVEIVASLKKDIDHLQVVTYKPNRGKGYAVRKGVEHSSGRVILFTDADNSTPIQEFEQFYPTLRENEVVIGSRYRDGSNIVIKQPWYRILVGRAGNMLIQFFLLDGITDTQCGFKAMQHSAARNIFSRMKIDRFGFDIEMLAIGRLLDYSIKELPVSWYNSSESRVRPLKDAMRTFAELIYIKINLWSGRYS
jgi:dolichyl-phosphate beta-glucosyltransferase